MKVEFERSMTTPAGTSDREMLVMNVMTALLNKSIQIMSDYASRRISTEETYRRMYLEQEAAANILGYEYEEDV